MWLVELSVVDLLPLYVVVVGMTAIERNQRRGSYTHPIAFLECFDEFQLISGHDIP
jgi:hypothetical protein